MKYLILSIILLIPCFSIGQTREIEADNIKAQYQSGKLTMDEYRLYGEDWGKLLTELGGYPNLPYDVETKTIKFQYIFDVSTTKEVSFNRILEWASIHFGSLNSVLQYKDLPTGKIILKGNFDVTHKFDYVGFWGNKKEGITTTKCFQTYIFTIKDKKLKMEVSDIYYRFTFGGYLLSNTYVPESSIEMSIHTIYPVTNFESKDWKSKLDLLYQTNLYIKDYSKDIFEYVEANIKDYSF